MLSRRTLIASGLSVAALATLGYGLWPHLDRYSEELDRQRPANVTFKWKDCRASGVHKPKTMTITTPEFIRRFLIHVLPSGFHRIRRYGFLASAARKSSVETIRVSLGASDHGDKRDEPTTTDEAAAYPPLTLRQPCPDCGGTMRIIETFKRGQSPCYGVNNQTAARGPPTQGVA